MTAYFPLPRQTRETDILAGNGGATYGPFAFSIFDIEDVVAFVSRDGGGFELEAASIAKTSPQPFAPFLVTFATPIAIVDRFRIVGRRLHERSTDVLRGGAISAAGLERELSAQTVTLQELRRDNSRMVEFSDAFMRDRGIILAEIRAILDSVEAIDDEVEANAALSRAAALTIAADVSRSREILEQASAGFTGWPSGSVLDLGSITDPVSFFPQNWGSL